MNMIYSPDIFVPIWMLIITQKLEKECCLKRSFLQKEVSHESQISKVLFPTKRLVSNRAIVDCTNFRYDSMSQTNLIE